MDKKDNDDGLTNAPKDLVSAFLQKNKNNIADEFERRIKATLGRNDELLNMTLGDLPEIVEREVDFVTNIINSYNRWSKEEDVIVFWDVDDTLGKTETKDGKEQWRFRPSMILLLKFLNESYPKIRNGIITNREDAEKLIDPDGSLAETSAFFDRECLISTRSMKVDRNIFSELSSDSQIDLGTADPDLLNKLVVLIRLNSEGKNIKIIDNANVAKVWGENGVYVGRQQQDY